MQALLGQTPRFAYHTTGLAHAHLAPLEKSRRTY